MVSRADSQPPSWCRARKRVASARASASRTRRGRARFRAPGPPCLVTRGVPKRADRALRVCVAGHCPGCLQCGGRRASVTGVIQPAARQQPHRLRLGERRRSERLGDVRGGDRRNKPGDGGRYGDGEHHVHPVVSCHPLQAGPEGARCHRGGGVHRVLDRGSRWQHAAQPVLCLPGECRHLQPAVRARVGGQHPSAALPIGLSSPIGRPAEDAPEWAGKLQAAVP